MNKCDYFSKAKKMLNDQKTYKVLKKDPTTKYQNKFNTLIMHWLNKEYISKTTADKIKCDTGTIPKFYALPKVHKRDIPLRSIISACSSPCFHLSKFYHKILSNITGMKRSFIKNSEDFVEKVRHYS